MHISKERAADIKDVTYRIKSHIMGIKLSDLSLIDEPVVIVAYDLTPSDTAQLDKEFTKGLLLKLEAVHHTQRLWHAHLKFQLLLELQVFLKH